MLKVKNASIHTLKNIIGKTEYPKELSEEFQSDNFLWKIDRLAADKSKEITFKSSQNQFEEIETELEKSEESAPNSETATDTKELNLQNTSSGKKILPSLSENKTIRFILIGMLLLSVSVIFFLKKKYLMFVLILGTVFSLQQTAYAVELSETIRSILKINSGEEYLFITEVSYELDEAETEGGTEEKESDFDNLSQELQALLISNIEDNRTEQLAENHWEHFVYYFDQNEFYTQIHSGIGRLHPIMYYAITKNDVIPLQGVVSASNPEYGYEEAPIKMSQPISKDSLYQDYQQNQGKWDEILAKLVRDGEIKELNLKEIFLKICEENNIVIKQIPNS